MADAKPITASPLTLKAEHWRDVRRLQEAASVPFRSLHFAGGDEEFVVQKLQRALLFLEENSNRFPDRFLPHPFGPDGPSGVQWGPFDFDDPRETFYGVRTGFSVIKFQKQAGLKPDGKAGMQTLPRIDEILVFLGNSAVVN
jgi:hypothetical protein